MSNSKRIIKAVAAYLLVIGIVIGASCSKSPDEKSTTTGKSVDTLFAVEVKNLEFTISQIDQYFQGISPIPVSLQMLVKMQLGGILGSPDLAGLNMGGNLRVVGVLLDDDADEGDPLSRMLIAGMLPVSDYSKFVGDNPKFSKPDKNGVSELTVSLSMPGIPTNPNAAPSGPAMLIAKFNDEYALVGSKGQYHKFVAYKKLFSGGKAADPLTGITAKNDYPVSIHGNIQAASKAFGPLITEKINEMKGQLSQAGAPGMMGGQEMMRGVIDMYVGLLYMIMEEVDSFTLAIKPSPDALFIKEIITVVPGTDTAAMLVADPQAPEKNDLLGYLENGAGMNFAVKMNKPFWKKLSLSMIDFQGTLAGQNVSPEGMTKIKKLMTDSMDAMGASLAGALSVDNEGESLLAMNSVISVADAESFNKMLDESAESLKETGILGICKSLGIEMDFTINRDTESYKGVSIDSAKLTMKSTEPNSPQGQMIEAMYGGGFDYRLGIADKLCAVAIGGDVDAAVHELIDKVKTGGPEDICSEIKDALKMLPEAEKADFFVTYNSVRLLKMTGRMMPLGMTMPEIDVPSKSNINIAGTIAGGEVIIDIALPKQHLGELATAGMMMIQQMQK